MNKKFKYLLTFIIIFIMIFTAGFIVITNIDHAIYNKDINNINFIVKDKYVANNNDASTIYYVKSSNDNIYRMENKKLYDKVEINKEYAFVTYGNRNIHQKKYPIVIEVHNIAT